MSEFYSGQHLSNLSLVNSKQEQDAQELIKKIKLNSLKLYSKQNCLKLPLQQSTLDAIPNLKSDTPTSLVLSQVKQEPSQLKQINAQLERQIIKQELKLRHLDKKIHLSQSEAELKQARNNLSLTKIKIGLKRLKRIAEISQQLNNLQVNSVREHRKLIVELNLLKANSDCPNHNLWLEQQKLEQQRAILIQTVNKERAIEAKKLLHLNLKRHQVSAEKDFLVAQLTHNRAELILDRTQQQAFNARQVKIQIQRELDIALNSGDRQDVHVLPSFSYYLHSNR